MIKFKIYLLAGIVGLLAYFPTASGSDGPSGMHPQNQIVYVKQQIKLGKEPFVAAFKQLKGKADSSLLVSSHAVADYSVPGYYVDKDEHIKNRLPCKFKVFVLIVFALPWP